MIQIFTAILLSAAWSNSGAQLDCNFETVKKFCEKMKEKEKTQLKSKSPHKFSSGEQMVPMDDIENQLIVLRERQENNQPLLSYTEHKKFKKVHEKMKKYARESILQGREESELSVFEKSILARLMSMGLSDLTNPIDQSSCLEKGGYAYSPATNNLILCPMMAGYPESALIWAMSAFAGRGIATCSTQIYTPKVMGPNGPHKAAKMPALAHPFQDFCTESGCKPESGLMACLADAGYPNEAKFDASSDLTKKTVDNLIPALANTPDYQSMIKKGPKDQMIKNAENREAAKSVILENKGCFPEITNYRVDSGIQDWFGSDVTARYLADHPIQAKTPEDNLEPLASVVDFVCRYPNANEITTKFHAPIETRINGGIFSNPIFRKALNCNPVTSAKKNCTVSARFKKKATVPTSDGSAADGQH